MITAASTYFSYRRTFDCRQEKLLSSERNILMAMGGNE
jgi:hypothetical protein